MSKKKKSNGNRAELGNGNKWFKISGGNYGEGGKSGGGGADGAYGNDGGRTSRVNGYRLGGWSLTQTKAGQHGQCSERIKGTCKSNGVAVKEGQYGKTGGLHGIRVGGKGKTGGIR